MQVNIRRSAQRAHRASGERRAEQLGLRGEILSRYVREWIVDIEGISDFVRVQREELANEGVAALKTPREKVYPTADIQVAARLGLDPTRALK